MNYLAVNFSLKADIAENQNFTVLEYFEIFLYCQHINITSVIHSYFELLTSL
jgi:hypothetical protein